MTKLSALGTESTFGLSDFLTKVKAGGAGDVNVTFQNFITALLGSGAFGTAVQSQANAGTAGGTMYYISLSGIKILWGVSSSQQFASGSTPTFTLPTSFFSTIQAAFTNLNNINTTAQQSANFISVNTTTITCSTYTAGALAFGETIFILAIGT